MPTCEAYKRDGVQCGVVARNDTRCGRHPVGPDDQKNYRAYSIDRLMFLYTLTTPGTVPLMLTRHDIELGFPPIDTDVVRTHIEAVEAVLRIQYPMWTKPFCRTDLTKIRASRRTQYKQDAIDRIPARLAGRTALLEEWYRYFKTSCTRAFARIGRPILIDEDDLYDPDYVRAQLVPRLDVSWIHIPNEFRDHIHRCFVNLGAFGQRYIGRLANRYTIPRNDFTDDAQNVHRTETVNYVKEIFEKLVKIAVPSEQNTLSEIIGHCQLGPSAIVLLAKHYCEPVDIYEIPRAYPRALDSVWAYIRQNAEKTELYERVKQELTDNVGMCAQGNLSRLCNILSGYIDGVAPVSKSEILQQKISVIAGDAEGNKVERARTLLRELGFPEAEWGVWLDAVAEL